MKLMSRFSRFSIRFLLIVVLGVAVTFGVLRIPAARSARLLDHVHSGRNEDALAMLTHQCDGLFLTHFKDLLRSEDVSVSASQPGMAQYLSCERTVLIGNDMITFEFAVGLSSVECRSIIEPLVSRGEI